MPTDLKKARVAPVYKRDKTAHKRNYRPFSVRQDFSKKKKKKKKSEAFFFFNTDAGQICEIINKSEFGFLPGKHTTRAIISFVGNIV